MEVVLKFSVLANHVVDHVIVGILLVVYSGVDHINTTGLSPQSCHSTSPASIPASAPMEDDDPDDLYGSQEVAGESKDRPPLEVVDLTAETEVPTDRAEEAPALENMEPLPVHKPLREIDPSAGHQVSGQHCIRSLGRIRKTAPYLLQTGMR